MKAYVLAGTHSGVGKTTISLGIMAALTKRGYNVAPFKVGPDYIDPSFHKHVTNNPSYNLDTNLLDEQTVKYLFHKHMDKKDIGMIEGVMGLYDGLNFNKDNGSTAHLAKQLNLPVILVIDARGMAASVLALIKGYIEYDPNVQIKGIIMNRVANQSLYDYLKKPIEETFHIPCLGYLPINENIHLKSRHLGLIPAEEVSSLNEKIDTLVDSVEKHMDLNRLLEVANGIHAVDMKDAELEHHSDILGIFNSNSRTFDNGITNQYSPLTIGYALDEAFSFYYEDNLELLRKMGINLIPFSPLKDKQLPEHLDALYIGGGFPEVFAGQLEANKTFRLDLLSKLEQGMPAYAECGGLMYLCKGISHLDNHYNEMVGFLQGDVQMTERLQRFGYVDIITREGIKTKGHEFHHSLITGGTHSNSTYYYDITKSSNPKFKWQCGHIKNNVLGAYAHIHFYSNFKFIKFLLDKVIMIKKAEWV